MIYHTDYGAADELLIGSMQEQVPLDCAESHFHSLTTILPGCGAQQVHGPIYTKGQNRNHPLIAFVHQKHFILCILCLDHTATYINHMYCLFNTSLIITTCTVFVLTGDQIHRQTA